MDPETVVRDCMEAFEAGNFEDAASYISDDLIFSGPTPEPLGKKEFVGLQSSLIKAMPDWKFNHQGFTTKGNTVSLYNQITGTQTRDLPSLMPGMPALPATGKHVSIPREPLHITVVNDKVTRIEVEQVPGGGVPGLLQQLGVQMRA
jgi:hypothetical protein